VTFIENVNFNNFDEDVDNLMDMDIISFIDMLSNITTIDDVITYFIDIPDDFYSQEDIDASHEWGYFGSSSFSESVIHLDHGFYLSVIFSMNLIKIMSSLTQAISLITSNIIMTSSFSDIVICGCANLRRSILL